MRNERDGEETKIPIGIYCYDSIREIKIVAWRLPVEEWDELCRKVKELEQ